MDYGNPQDPTYYDATYYDAQYYGMAADKGTGSPLQPWYAASPSTQRRRSSGQTQVSLFSEDELDRYATIRPSTARPGVAPGSHGGLRRKSTNLDRYMNLSESANMVIDYAALSEQMLQHHQQPRYISHLAQIPEVPPLNARLAVSENRIAAFEPPLQLPPPLPMQMPQVFAAMEEPPEVAAAQKKKSTISKRWAKNSLSKSPVVARSDPKEISSPMVSNVFRTKKMFRSDECGDRNWASRQDATAHSLPVASTEELKPAVPVPNTEAAQLSCPAMMIQEDSLPPPMELSPSQSSHASESSSESSSTASSSTEYSEDDSEVSRSASGFGETVSKSTRFSNNGKSAVSCYGTPSPLPTPSTSVTTMAMKTPEVIASAISKNSPSASKKSREHRSSLKTLPPNTRTFPELRSKSNTPPSIASTKGPLNLQSRSRSHVSSAKTYSAPRSRSRTPATLSKTPPILADTTPPTCPTPPPTPRTPPSILRTPQRSSAKTVSSRTQAMVAEARERMLSSSLHESFCEEVGAEYAMPEIINDRSNSSRNQDQEFHSERSAQYCMQPPLLQRHSRNSEQSKRISMGRFPSKVNSTSHSLPPESSSHREVIIPKYIPHSIALIQHDAVASMTKMPVTSLSMPVAKGAQAHMDHAVGVAPASRLMRANYGRSHSSSMGRESLTMYLNKFPAAIKENKRRMQKVVSAQTTPKRKSRSSKGIQHPDLMVSMELPYVETLESSNFQSSEASTGRPLISPVKERSKSDGSMLMHLCVAINVVLFSALSGIVFAYFLHVGTIKKI